MPAWEGQTMRAKGRAVRLFALSASLALLSTLLVAQVAYAGIDPRGTYDVVAHRTSPCCGDFAHTWTISTFDSSTGNLSGTGTQPNSTLSGTLSGSQITIHVVYQDGSGYT